MRSEKGEKEDWRRPIGSLGSLGDDESDRKPDNELDLEIAPDDGAARTLDACRNAVQPLLERATASGDDGRVARLRSLLSPTLR